MIDIRDFLDKKLLTHLQESFADLLGFSVVFEDLEAKPISKKRCFRCKACRDFIDVKETRGAELCLQSDKHASDIARKRGKPYLYSCHMGFSNVAIPIIVGSEPVGSLYAGQFFAEKPANPHLAYGDLYKELGQSPSEISQFFEPLDDETLDKRAREELFLSPSQAKSLVQAYNEEKKKPQKTDHVIKAIRLLSLVADTISNTASDLAIFKQHFSNISKLSDGHKKSIASELREIEKLMGQVGKKRVDEQIISLWNNTTKKLMDTELDSVRCHWRKIKWTRLIWGAGIENELKVIHSNAQNAKTIAAHLEIIAKLDKKKEEITSQGKKYLITPIILSLTILGVIIAFITWLR